MKQTYILGISAFYHDSAATLVKNGEIIAAVQEERFTRKKHDSSFPIHSINYCLKEANITIDDIDYIVFYEKVFEKFERLIETYLHFAPRGITSFLASMPVWIKEKIYIKDTIRNKTSYKGEILFSRHHLSHAASAFYPSPFKEAAILTIDGVGEWETTTYGTGKDNHIELWKSINFPHSLGLLYSAFTYYLGFKVNSGEYKLMGLAPYGKPKYTNIILDNLIDVKEDGSFRLNLEYFDYHTGLKMINNKFIKLFGMPPRKPDETITEKHTDIASSIQRVTEEIILKMVNHIYKETGMKYLTLAGGVALNSVANGRILRESPFENIWIQPASGDAGGSLGSALLIWYKYLNNPRNADNKNDFQKYSYLGPSFTNKEIEKVLNRYNAKYQYKDYDEIIEIGSDLINEGKVIGWFQGRMEFGPRALGNRSIIGDARNKEMQRKMNLKIKFRESFRPFAPSVLEEKVSDYFEIDRHSPYMLIVTPVKENIRKYPQKELKGLEKLNFVRSSIPAVTHVDYSARIQTVNEKQNPLYHKLIKRFYEKYGCAVIINTSFNVRGEPIVCTPEEAFLCFMRTDMDYLIIGNYILKKEEQPQIDRSKFNDFEPD